MPAVDKAARGREGGWNVEGRGRGDGRERAGRGEVHVHVGD